MLKEGLEHSSVIKVSDTDTAAAWGSGDMPVLATPRMVALMENAAMLAVASELGENETTVGGHIDTSHLAPSAVGDEVTATARLVKVDGKRLDFEVEARSGDKLLSKGTHKRFIVNRDRFLGKLGS